MPPTQRHRWLTRPDSRERRRRADLVDFVMDQARADFEAHHGDARFGPVVALVAAYEEEQNIGDVLKAMPTLVGDLEVSTLVVVDGGRDDTAQVALDAGVFTCVLPVNLGHGAALQLGYELAVANGARYVVTLDADGQNDPARDGHDGAAPARRDRRLRDRLAAARGRPDHRPVPAGRRHPLRLDPQRHLSQHLTDSSNGYRAFTIELLEDIAPHLVQDQYQTAEVVITASSRGWRITEQPTVWHPRASGTSKKGGNLVFGLQYARVIATTWSTRVALQSPASPAGGRRQ